MIDTLLHEIVTPHVIGAGPDDSIMHALDIMRLNKISCIVAMEEGAPVGIITERNILMAATRHDVNFDKAKVRDLMSAPVTTVTGAMRVYEAYLLLAMKNIRHLVMVDDAGKAAGVITLSNLVELLENSYSAEIKKVSQVMTPDALTVPKEMALSSALSLMAGKSISCLVVEENNAPVGIISERDLVRLLVVDNELNGRKVHEVMTSPVLTLNGDEPAFKASIMMREESVRRLIIVNNDNRVVGLVTQSDIVRGLENRYVKTLRKYLWEKNELLQKVSKSLIEKSIYLDTILRSSKDTGIVAMDTDLLVTYYNPTAEEMLGRTYHAVVGNTIEFLQDAHPQLISWVMSAARRLAPEDELHREFDASSASPRILHACLSGIWDKGALMGFALMMRDITQQRQDQDRLANMNRELEELVEERTRDLNQKAEALKLANARLQELDSLKTDFLSSVSHELRTPLTSLVGFTKLISRDFSKNFIPLAQDDSTLSKSGHRILDNISIIEATGQRMTRMLNDFLDLTKIESGQMVWRDEKIQPSKFIEAAVRTLDAMVRQQKDVSLVLETPDDLPEVYVDCDRLEQVMINLLTNAFKHTTKGTVGVSARVCDEAPRKSVTISVADTGVGIDSNDLELIFKRFHQAEGNPEHSYTLDDKGTGLGLAICKQIIENYSGSIWAESTPGKGSVFSFTLPCDL